MIIALPYFWVFLPEKVGGLFPSRNSYAGIFIPTCLIMKRNISILALLLLSTIFSAKAQTRKAKPNIIYIYADDMGYGELGCYGQQKIRTPNLDKLAKEGIRFTQHYASTPVCAPSRCQLMTGKHGGHSYIRGNYELGGFADSTEGGQMPLYPNALTIGKILQKEGYKTACIGKWGMGMSNTTGDPNKQGFDYFYGFLDQKQAHNHYPTHLWENGKWDTLNNPPIEVHRKVDKNNITDATFDYYIGKEYAVNKIAEKALNFVKNNRKSPFFLYLPFPSPHLSLQAPKEAVQEYIGRFDEKPYLGEKGYCPVRYPKSTYAAMITTMDKRIGEVIELVKNLGLDDNTIIMFSSDNGASTVGGVDTEFFKSLGDLKGAKMEVYEGGIRVPFIARWPAKIPAGKVTNHASVQYDLMATINELLGIKGIQTDGTSFLPTLLNKEKQQKQHEFIYWEYPENGGQVAIRIGNWKGVKRDMIKNRQAKWELYDLNKDVTESYNIAEQHPEIITQLSQILKREHTPSHIKDWEFVSPKF